ncbi:MAG: hypothetical protein HYU30_09050 [Chloroflexi bacterium]|nr:hypothetical protein [Chloroflexota bacterium]
MPTKKKVTELPDEQAIRKLFPKKVVEKLKEVAHEKDDKPEKQKES